MDIAVNEQEAGHKDTAMPENHGKTKQIYMNYSGPGTITVTREELHHHPGNVAIDELRDWLKKHAANPEIADLCAAVEVAVSKAKII